MHLCYTHIYYINFQVNKYSTVSTYTHWTTEPHVLIKYIIIHVHIMHNKVYKQLSHTIYVQVYKQ